MREKNERGYKEKKKARFCRKDFIEL